MLAGKRISENFLRVAGAFGAIATADAETKGASRDPQRAVEKAIITICRLHGR